MWDLEAGWVVEEPHAVDLFSDLGSGIWGFGVSGFGFRVSDFGFGVWGLGLRV